MTAGLLYLAVSQQAGVYEQALITLGALMLFMMVAYPVIERPVIGLIVLAPAAILPPIPLGPETGMSLAYLLAPSVFCGWLLSRFSSEGGVALVSSRVYRPLVCLMVAVVIAFGAGQYRWFGSTGASMTARVGGLCVFLFSAAVFVMAAHEMRNIRWLKRAVWILLAAGAALLISALLVALGFEGAELTAKDQGLGSMFWTWLLAMSFSQAIANRDLSLLTRGVCLAITLGALALLMGVWMDWASGWFPGCVAMGVTLLVYRPRVAIVAGIFLGIALVANSTAAKDIAWTPDQVYSTKTRTAAAETLYQIAKENPITGFGPANYYHYTPLFPILGWYVHFSSHNNYFDLVLQTGLLGLFCVGWLWCEIGFLSWTIRHDTRPGFEAAFVYGAMGGLAGTAVSGALGDWFLPFVYNVGLYGFGSSILAWVFLGGLVAIATMRLRRRPEAETF